MSKKDIYEHQVKVAENLNADDKSWRAGYLREVAKNARESLRRER